MICRSQQAADAAKDSCKAKADREGTNSEERIQERNATLASLKRSCAETISKWPSKAPDHRSYSSGSVLPVDVWIIILKKLCNGMERRGVRSPSVIARDICNASQTSKEMWKAGQVALEHLSSLCPLQKHACQFEQDWDSFLAQPMSVPYSKVVTLFEECIAIWKVPVEYGHSELAALFLRGLKLAGPSNVPFRLLMTVAAERQEGHLLTRLVEMHSYLNLDLEREPRLHSLQHGKIWILLMRYKHEETFKDFQFRKSLTELGIQTTGKLIGTVLTAKQQFKCLNLLVDLSDSNSIRAPALIYMPELGGLQDHDSSEFQGALLIAWWTRQRRLAGPSYLAKNSCRRLMAIRAHASRLKASMVFIQDTVLEALDRSERGQQDQQTYMVGKTICDHVYYSCSCSAFYPLETKLK